MPLLGVMGKFNKGEIFSDTVSWLILHTTKILVSSCTFVARKIKQALSLTTQ